MKSIIRALHLRDIRNVFNIWLVNHIFSGASQKWFNIKRYLLNHTENFSIGENTKVVGPIYNSTKLQIGDNCWIGKNFYCNGSGVVKVGNNCDIAPEVIINTGGHIVGTSDRRAGTSIINNITIGDGCWLCARSTIVNNVNIGHGCIILPCACVIKDILSNSMVGGDTSSNNKTFRIKHDGDF